MYGPPGHMPGIHIPGTLVPIGAVVAAEQRRRARAEQESNEAARCHQELQHAKRRHLRSVREDRNHVRVTKYYSSVQLAEIKQDEWSQVPIKISADGLFSVCIHASSDLPVTELRERKTWWNSDRSRGLLYDQVGYEVVVIVAGKIGSRWKELARRSCTSNEPEAIELWDPLPLDISIWTYTHLTAFQDWHSISGLPVEVLRSDMPGHHGMDLKGSAPSYEVAVVTRGWGSHMTFDRSQISAGL